MFLMFDPSAFFLSIFVRIANILYLYSLDFFNCSIWAEKSFFIDVKVSTLTNPQSYFDIFEKKKHAAKNRTEQNQVQLNPGHDST